MTLSIASIAYKVYVNLSDTATDILPHYLYLAGSIFVATSAVLVGVSRIRPIDEDRDWDSLLWTTEYFRSETDALSTKPRFTNYRYQGALLLAAVVALLLVL